MVYTGDLKSPAARIEGSSPSSRTKRQEVRKGPAGPMCLTHFDYFVSVKAVGSTVACVVC